MLWYIFGVFQTFIDFLDFLGFRSEKITDQVIKRDHFISKSNLDTGQFVYTPRKSGRIYLKSVCMFVYVYRIL